MKSQDDQRRVWIILEVNCYEPEPSASVWVVLGSYDPMDDNAPDFPDADGAIKIIGPVPTQKAGDAYQALSVMFERIGYTVQTLETADD